jgi:Uncharacterised protein family UPF0547
MVASIVIAVVALLWLLFIWPIFKAHSIGKRKGSEYGWIWGFALGWIGVLIVLNEPDPQPPPILAPYTPEPARSALKTCPQCAEEVKPAAKVCRFCGHRFSPGEQPLPSEA